MYSSFTYPNDNNNNNNNNGTTSAPVRKASLHSPFRLFKTMHSSKLGR